MTAKKNTPAFPRVVPVVAARDPRFDQRAQCGLECARLFDEREPGEAAGEYRRRVQQARALCAGCPVQQDCLQFGTANRSSGVAGGIELVRGVPQQDPLPRRRRMSVT